MAAPFQEVRTKTAKQAEPVRTYRVDPAELDRDREAHEPHLAGEWQQRWQLSHGRTRAGYRTRRSERVGGEGLEPPTFSL